MKRKCLFIMLAILTIVGFCSCKESKNTTSSNPESPAECSFTPVTHRVCAGASAMAVLLDDGRVVCSLDESKDQYISVNNEWKTWNDIADIEMNEEILVAAKKDGSVVWCGGRVKEYDFLSDKKVMGVIDSWTNVVSVAAGCYDIAALKSDGSIEITGSIRTQDLSEKSGFTQISLYDALLCLRNDGTVYCYAPKKYEGQNWKYDVSEWKDIKAVSAGFDHAIGLKKDGTVVATGNNEFGQCNVSSWTDIKQIRAGRGFTIALKSDGTVVYCGEIYDNVKKAMSSWTDMVEISGFFDQFIGLKSDGTIVYTGLDTALNPVKINSIK